MTHDPIAQDIIEEQDKVLAEKNNYIEYLTDNYIASSTKLNELISYIESDEYGNLISKHVIVRALKKLSEEM